MKIRILLTDFSFIFKDQHEKLYKTFLPTLDTLIADSPKAASRDNLKDVVSLHPATHMRVHVATHHQKFMVLKTGESTTAFCGGLDCSRSCGRPLTGASSIPPRIAGSGMTSTPGWRA